MPSKHISPPESLSRRPGLRPEMHRRAFVRLDGRLAEKHRRSVLLAGTLYFVGTRHGPRAFFLAAAIFLIAQTSRVNWRSLRF